MKHKHTGPAPGSVSPGATVPAKVARELILRGIAPSDLTVLGVLDLSDARERLILPEGLTGSALLARNCRGLEALPGRMKVHRVDVSGCAHLRELPAGLSCTELHLNGTPIRTLPEGLQVRFRLDLSQCTELEALPAGLQVGVLHLRGCRSLRRLPENLDVSYLDISDCDALTGWPAHGQVRCGALIARMCPWLTELPPWLREISQLDVTGCRNLSALPADLRITSWLDITESGIQALPPGLRQVMLRWRGLPVPAHAIFAPHTLTAGEVVGEPNAEVRRVLLERMGLEHFFAKAHATVLDRDQDAGGLRRLVRVHLPGDEDLVCLAVACPSTARQYLLRVPPSMTSCHQAAAWMAGFDDPADYRPIQET